MTIDLDDLAAKAKAATPGPWHALSTGVRNGDHWYVTDDGEAIAYLTRNDGDPGDKCQENTAFIVAANPSVILELIDRLRAAESALFRVAGYVRASSERVRRGIDGTAYPEVARPGWEPEGGASND